MNKNKELISKTTKNSSNLFIFLVESRINKEIFSTIKYDSEYALKMYRRIDYININSLHKIDNNIRNDINLSYNEYILAKATRHINHHFSDNKTSKYLKLI